MVTWFVVMVTWSLLIVTLSVVLSSVWVLFALFVWRYEMVRSDDGSIRGTIKLLEKQKLQNLKKYEGKQSRRGEGFICATFSSARLDSHFTLWTRGIDDWDTFLEIVDNESVVNLIHSLQSTVAELVERKTGYWNVASLRLTAGRVAVSLIKTFYALLSTGLTQEGRKLSQHDWKIVDCYIKHQHKQTIIHTIMYNDSMWAQQGNAHSMAKIDDFLIQCRPFLMHLFITYLDIALIYHGVLLRNYRKTL